MYKGEKLTPANGGWDIGKLYSVPNDSVTIGVVVDESMSKPIDDVSFCNIPTTIRFDLKFNRSSPSDS